MSNVYAEKYPTVRDRYAVFFRDKLVVIGNHLPSVEKYARANTGTSIVDMRKGEVIMSWDEIKKELESGEYLKEVVADRPTLPPGEPMNYRASLDAPPTQEEIDAILHTYSDGAVLHESGKITLPTVEKEAPVDIPEALSQDKIAPSHRGRGRPMKYDLSALKVGGHLVYEGKEGQPVEKALASARVMACLAGQKHGGKFKAVINGNEVRITRMS